MTSRRRVAARQLDILLDFAETHRDIALGRFAGGPQAAQAQRASWESVAMRLNSIEDGPTKTANQWRRYWIELKAKIKNKAADSRRSAAATGGGPSKILPLSEQEQRLLAIIGPVAVVGLPGVRLPVNMPSVDENRGEPLGAEVIDSSSELMEEEWLEVESFISTTSPSAELQPAQDESTPRQAPPSTGPRPVRRLSRQLPENAPQWAYEIESRRVAAEETQAAAMERLASSMEGLKVAIQEQMQRQAAALEALLEVVRAMNQK